MSIHIVYVFTLEIIEEILIAKITMTKISVSVYIHFWDAVTPSIYISIMP